MNKKPSLTSVMVAILVIALCVFILANRKSDILDMKTADIKYIYIEDIDTGKSAQIDNLDDLDRLVKNLNSIKVKRYNPSEEYDKISIKITPVSKSGKDIDGAFQSFIVESSQRIIAKNDNYYTVEGEFDVDLIKEFLK